MSRSRGVVLGPAGPLDADACAQLRKAISAALAAGSRAVVLDFSRVEHLEVDAVNLLRGLRSYLAQHGGGLVVVRPSAEALRGLRMNELEDLLTVTDLPGLAAVPEPQSA